VAGSVAVLGHLRWAWMPAAIMLEWASMVAFARMLRRLLTAGRARFRLLPVLATVYAANAVSVSVPLAGPELATAFTFRRITRQGADAPLAGWSLLAGGVASTVAGALVIAGGGLASGNILASGIAVPGGVLAVAVLVAFAVAARRLGELRLSPAGWMTVTGWAVANWLADAGVLAVSILAVGAAVPWPDLLLA
jgi:putative heme transporter